MTGSKVLYLDLDGTLLNDDKTISEKNKDAIAAALDGGNYVVLATGRPVESGRKVVRKLGLTMPGCYMVAYNGAVTYDCSADVVLTEKTLPIEDVEYLFYKAREAGIYIQTYGKNCILTERRMDETDYYMQNGKIKCKIGAVRDNVEEEPHKVLMIDLKSRENLEKFQRENREWEMGKCSSFFANEKYLEYCPLGINKGTGAEYIREFLNIPVENTIAIGDDENDIPMLQKAYIGVAMKNASEKVKEAADYITMNDNNEDGVAEVIEKYILPMWG